MTARPPAGRVGRAAALALLVSAASTIGSGPARAQLIPELKLRMPGLGPGYNFGACVAPAGDVNGDGYPDFLVGAPRAPGLAAQAGRAYVLLGGPDMDSLADLTLLGRYASGNFGLRVAGIGDFNGDGYDDWVVGNPGYNQGSTSGTYGRAWVFYGGAQLNESYRLSLAPPTDVFAFGSSVAGVGDVNGDGYPDFAVGGSVNNGVNGTVSLYFGGPSADGFSDFTLQVGRGNSVWAIAGPGDINGDGWNDILVGIHGPSSSSGPGRVLVFLGGPGLSAQPSWQISPSDSSASFGFSVAGAGDVNGDGIRDFLVGSPASTANGKSGAGKVLLYYGGPGPLTTPALVLDGENANDNFGSSVAGAGDLDGDGFADFVAGAPLAGVHGLDSGRAYVFFGGANPDTIPGAVVDGEAAGDFLGSSVSGASDPDLGGTDAFLLGAPLNDSGGLASGCAYLMRVERYHVVAPAAGEHWTAGGSADVRWDGADPADLALTVDGGASWTTLATGVGGAASNRFTVAVPDQVSGRARLRVARTGFPPLAGNAALSPFVHVTRPIRAPAAVLDEGRTRSTAGVPRLGRAVASGVDWDGDGRPDLFAGAAPDPDGAMLVTGEPGGSPIPPTWVKGLAPGEDFGAAIADIGDFDGDGWHDLAVGAPGYDGAHVDEGRVYVYRGGPGADHGAPLTIDASGAGELFGSAIASADLNGDGKPDLIVGAPGVSGMGHVYVFLGGHPGNTLPDAVLDAGLPGPYGARVSRAGDVNGDGYEDLLVSGPALPNGNGASTVHLVFGGPDVRHLHRVVLEGANPGDGFGAALAPLGDFDGDGFADFAIGAPLSDSAGTDAGEVRLYFGSPGFLPRLGMVVTGAHPGDQFGAALAGGADLNADGFPDLAIGSPAASDGGPQSGRVDILFGGSDSHLDLTRVGASRSYFGSSIAARATGADSLLATLAVGAPLAGSLENEDRGSLIGCAITRWTVTDPIARTRWPVGSTQPVRWRGSEPADVWFAGANGGATVRLAAAAGGADSNQVEVRADASLPDSGRVVLLPGSGGAVGRSVSPGLVSIERSVTLESFTWQAGLDGVSLRWSSDPAPGPAGIAGYRLRRIRAGASPPGERIGPDPLVAATLLDPDARPGDTYVLSAVNALGQEIEIGRLTLPAGPVGIRVWPQPARQSGVVTVQFAAPRAPDGRIASDLVAEIFDARGRWITTLLHGTPEARLGVVTLSWNGRNHQSVPAGPGLYFLRVRSAIAGYSTTRRIVMLDTPDR